MMQYLVSYFQMKRAHRYLLQSRRQLVQNWVVVLLEVLGGQMRIPQPLL